MSSEFERALEAAFIEACQIELDALPSEPALKGSHWFSDEFEEKMQKMIKGMGTDKTSKKQTGYMGSNISRGKIVLFRGSRTRKIKLAIAAAAIIALLTATAVAATMIFRLERYDDHSDAIFGEEQLAEPEEFEVLEPVLPDGFEVVNEWLPEENGGYMVAYQNQEGVRIRFVQETASALNISVNTEFDEGIDVYIAGYQGFAYSSGNPDYNKDECILWTDGIYVYIFSGNCSYEYLYEIAVTTAEKIRNTN